jgi:hypothetical protein
MNPLFTVSSINFPSAPICRISKKMSLKLTATTLMFTIIISGSFLFWRIPSAYGQEGRERENMELSVVAVNPSKTDIKSVPIKMDLPKEVTPNDIIDSGGLEVEFDTERSIYYLYKEEVKLNPAETKVFNVEIRDVWIVPQKQVDALKEDTATVLSRLEGTEFYEPAQRLGETINNALDTVVRTQNDETVSRRRHIGVYRNNVKIIDQVKEDIARLEKKLTLPQALPVPEVLEKPEIKTEAPSKTTTWMIIFIIMLFMGMLAGVFFFTWQTQAHFSKNLISSARNLVFPKRGGSAQEDTKEEEEQPE